MILNFFEERRRLAERKNGKKDSVPSAMPTNTSAPQTPESLEASSASSPSVAKAAKDWVAPRPRADYAPGERREASHECSYCFHRALDLRDRIENNMRLSAKYRESTEYKLLSAELKKVASRYEELRLMLVGGQRKKLIAANVEVEESVNLLLVHWMLLPVGRVSRQQ